MMHDIHASAHTWSKHLQDEAYGTYADSIRVYTDIRDPLRWDVDEHPMLAWVCGPALVIWWMVAIAVVGYVGHAIFA